MTLSDVSSAAYVLTSSTTCSSPVRRGCILIHLGKNEALSIQPQNIKKETSSSPRALRNYFTSITIYKNVSLTYSSPSDHGSHDSSVRHVSWQKFKTNINLATSKLHKETTTTTEVGVNLVAAWSSWNSPLSDTANLEK